MTFPDSARRGVARAAGGALVVAAGAAGGLLAADMQADWSAAAALELASAKPRDHFNDVATRPVVVTIIKEKHVTPDPVVVVRKVYRWASGAGTSRPATTRSPQRSAPAPRTSRPKPSRTVVAPAKKAPAPQPAPASPATTSKQS